jgi:hypothetical protein
LDIEPARYFVQVIKCETRVCRDCEHSTMKMAPLPRRIVKKNLASNNVVIEAVASKYCDQSLYRQAVVLEREAGRDWAGQTRDSRYRGPTTLQHS